MKLEAGKASVALGHKGKLLLAEIQAAADSVIPMHIVDMEAMITAHDVRPDARGIPTIVAVNPHDGRLWVHPRPTQDFQIYLSLAPEGL